VGRVQGLIVGQGNPKAITTLDDLLRPDVRFVNRQPGAGTRVRHDSALLRRGLDAAAIAGYGQEEASHAAVAAAVAGGEADCGLGIQAAAHMHGLDFVPLFDERYDLVIPVECYESELLAPLLAIVQRPAGDFLRRVRALGGYDTAHMGQVLWEG
jgi:putative molybdopterin biosynthesis protein